ncbi:elongation of very long chain fatty acids protein 4 [Trichonephila clavipes]|nr:elongation of very long chain fatty acids protein 4 [Trichonephila clavipes]
MSEPSPYYILLMPRSIRCSMLCWVDEKYHKMGAPKPDPKYESRRMGINLSHSMRYAKETTTAAARGELGIPWDSLHSVLQGLSRATREASFRCLFQYWNVRCAFKESSQHERILQLETKYIWQLYLVKHLELLDTIFFVLRKKHNQISFLHVFHHSAVIFVLWWILYSRIIGMYMIFIAVVNNSIHVIMYMYYGLSAMGPYMQKYLWWKKYLTRIQIEWWGNLQKVVPALMSSSLHDDGSKLQGPSPITPVLLYKATITYSFTPI